MGRHYNSNRARYQPFAISHQQIRDRVCSSFVLWGIELMDWETKVRDLRRIINELEMLSHNLEGRNRMMLARSYDELKLFVSDLEQLLGHEQQTHHGQQELPDWLNQSTDAYAEDDLYDEAE
jgi:hypothetical protein